MPAHGMARNALTRAIDGEVSRNEIRELPLNIVAHLVMRGEGILRSVDVKSSAKAKIISGLCIVRHTFATRAGIGRDEDQTKLCAGGPKFTLLGNIRMGAGQARQIPDHRKLRARRMIRHEDREGHLCPRRAGGVLIHALRSTMAAIGGECFNGHDGGLLLNLRV